MPNAWLNPVAPLFICGALFIVGLATVRPLVRRQRAEGRGNPANPGFAGVLLMLTGGSVGLVILAWPGQWKRQELADHVFRTPPERIERFVVRAAEPNAYRPLTACDIVIDDPPRIRRIADALARAREFLPSRRRARWIANLEMVTRDGTFYFQVESAGFHNGTLVHVWSNSQGNGWNLGTVRADALEAIFEDAAKSASSH